MIFETVKFSDITVNHDKKRIPLSTMERSKRQGSYRYYGAQGVIDYIDDYIFDGKYLLIAEDGENLKSKKQNIAQLAEGRFWVNNHAHIVQCNERCRLEYLCFMLNSMDLSGYITGSAQPKLSQANMNNISFEIPSVEMQDLILSVILPIEKRIAMNTAINENLEQQAQAYFVDLFLINADPNWRIGTISDLGNVVGGGTPSKKVEEYYTSDGIAWITPKDLSNDKSKFVAHGETDITELGLAKSSATLMPKGAVLFSSRAPIGYIAIADGQVCTNQGFKSIVPFDNVGTAFVYYFLKENLSAIENVASGSTFKEVSGSTMKIFTAIIPDNDTLAEFQRFCSPLFEQQRALEYENRSLSSIRDTLLPKLMSGEIDVSAVKI